MRPAYQAIKSVMAKNLPEYSWEIIVVNDGSPDNSAQFLVELSSHDTKCGVVELSRNFDKEIALSAGVNYASGTFTFTDVPSGSLAGAADEIIELKLKDKLFVNVQHKLQNVCIH